MSNEKILTNVQHLHRAELCDTYGIALEQIEFEGTDPKPRFDYEAASLLSLRLTDVSMQTSSTFDVERNLAQATCLVTLADGRFRSVDDYAQVGEVLLDGTSVKDERHARNLARTRVSRLGLRSVGVDLWRAHLEYKRSGKIASADPTADVRQSARGEIHALAVELGLIVGGDRSEYEKQIAEFYEGRTSTNELNDIEFARFRTTLRAMARIQRKRAA